MALVDLRTVPSGITLPEGATGTAFDPGGKWYAYGDGTGAVWVRRFGDDGLVTRLSTDGRPAAWLIFSPDGRFLAGGPSNSAFVWNVKEGRLVVQIPNGSFGFDFSPDSREAAIDRSGGAVHVYDLATGRDRLTISTGFNNHGLAFSPDSRRLAATSPGGSSSVRVFDAKTGRLLQETILPELAASSPSWHPDGERLAVGGAVRRVFILHVPDGRMLAELEGHAQNVTDAQFTADGDHLLTHSWDGTVRLWEAATGRQLLSSTQFLNMDVRPGSSRLGYFTDRNRSVRFVELADDHEYCSFGHDLVVGFGQNRSVAVSPDGRLAALGADDGVRLWDLASGRELVHLQSPLCVSAAFTPDGRALLTSGSAGFQRWPIRADPSVPNGLLIGPPRVLNLSVAPAAFQLAPDGRTAAVVSEKSQAVVLIDMETEQVRPFHLDNPMASTVAVSPDGRWAASGGWHAPAQRIWDAHTGRMVKELRLGEVTGVYFSPDSRWLITSRSDEYCFWNVETWQPGLRIPREQEPYPGPAAFTHDGVLMAVELTPGVIGLLDWKSGRVLARLEDPTHDRASALCSAPTMRNWSQSLPTTRPSMSGTCGASTTTWRRCTSKGTGRPIRPRRRRPRRSPSGSMTARQAGRRRL